MPGNDSRGLYNGIEISILKNFTYNIWGCFKSAIKTNHGIELSTQESKQITFKTCLFVFSQTYCTWGMSSQGLKHLL